MMYFCALEDGYRDIPCKYYTVNSLRNSEICVCFPCVIPGFICDELDRYCVLRL